MISWLLQALERSPFLALTERELRTLDDAGFAELRSAELLRRERFEPRWGTASTVEGSRLLTVVENPDGTYVAFDDDDPLFEPVPVSVMDLPRWTVHFPALLRRFRQANGLQGQSGRLDERLFLLGTGLENFAVVLALLPQERLGRPLLFGLPNLVPPGYDGVLALSPTFRPSPELIRELDSLTVAHAVLDGGDPFLLSETAQQAVLRLARRRRAEARARHGGPIQFSDGYRSVSIHGTSYSFTPQQAQVFEILYQNWQNNTPDVRLGYIMDRLGKEIADVRQVFRTGHKLHEAWNTVIVQGGTRGTLKLKV